MNFIKTDTFKRIVVRSVFGLGLIYMLIPGGQDEYVPYAPIDTAFDYNLAKDFGDKGSDTLPWRQKFELRRKTIFSNARLSGAYSIVVNNESAVQTDSVINVSPERGEEQRLKTMLTLPLLIKDTVESVNLYNIEDATIYATSALAGFNRVNATKQIRIFHSYFKKARASFSSPKITFQECHFTNSEIQCRANNLLFKKIQINNSYFSAAVDTVEIDDVIVDSACKVKTVNYCKIKSVHGDGVLELIPDIAYGRDVKNNRLFNRDSAVFPTVMLNDVDLDHLKFEGEYFNFIVDSNQSYRARIEMYKKLIERFKDFPSSLEIYDVQYQQLVNQHEGSLLRDQVSAFWDNYGYRKEWIWYNSLNIFLVCFLINLLIYPNILYKGYVIEQFKIAEQNVYKYGIWVNSTLEIAYCFLYTAFLFWGFRLDLEKIKVSNLFLAVWIIVQYTIGLICLAYMANLIIIRN